MGFISSIIAFFSAALRLLGLIKAAETLFRKPVQPEKEVADVKQKQLEDAAAADRPVDSVLNELSKP